MVYIQFGDKHFKTFFYAQIIEEKKCGIHSIRRQTLLDIFLCSNCICSALNFCRVTYGIAFLLLI